jgi:hypothetical protein
MAIIRKADLVRDLEELKARFTALEAAVVGTEPNPNLFDQYHNNPEQYRQEFVEVDLTGVAYALDDFKTVLRRLGAIGKLQAPRRMPDK